MYLNVFNSNECAVSRSTPCLPARAVLRKLRLAGGRSSAVPGAYACLRLFASCRAHAAVSETMLDSLPFNSYWADSRARDIFRTALLARSSAGCELVTTLAFLKTNVRFSAADGAALLPL